MPRLALTGVGGGVVIASDPWSSTFSGRPGDLRAGLDEDAGLGREFSSGTLEGHFPCTVP